MVIAFEAIGAETLRVCADPNNLPFSNRQQEGFENKIASLFAKKLGSSLEYEWFPQRIGFIRNTLKAKTDDGNRFLCDLVMGVPTGFELTATTKPYYHSSYVFVYAKRGELKEIESIRDLLQLSETVQKKLKIGIFDRTPGANWLLKQGFIDQAVSYQAMDGDPESYPGQVIENDLLNGKLDAAIIWGPIAGYFSRQNGEQLSILLLNSEPGIRSDFRISMGVRYGEKQWLQTVERLIAENRSEIEQILREYHLPVIED